MKRLINTIMLSIVLSLMGGAQLQAQTLTLIMGKVTNGFGQPQPNFMVNFNLSPANTPTGGVVASTFTDSLGQYFVPLTASMNPGQISVDAFWNTCDALNLLMNDSLGLFNQGDTIVHDIVCSTSASCVADFIQSSSGLTVFFSNRSIAGSPIYTWDFGDGNTSVTANPIHTYNQPGTYNVCLTVSDRSTPSGCVDSFCTVITVGGQGGGGNPGGGTCDATFSATVYNDTVDFAPTVINPSHDYLWLFGDGNISITPAPTHIYGTPGTYIACLIVADSAGNCVDSFCTPILITTGSGGGGRVCASNFVSRVSNDTATFVNLSAGPSLSYFWDFGDGNTSNDQDPIHVYATPGLYNACLTVVDSANNCVDVSCNAVRILPSNTGNCSATFTAVAVGGDSILITPPTTNNGSLIYVLDYGDGNLDTLQTSAANPVLNPFYYVYAQSGWYQVCLTVFDANGTCWNQHCNFVTVPGRQTTCTADFSATNTTGNQVQFTNLSQGGRNSLYVWDFGDGNTSHSTSPTHTYANPGVYQVCLLAIDSIAGCIDIKCDTVSVNPGQICDATFSISRTTATNQMAFMANYVDPTKTYSWDFGDGTTGSGPNASHTYTTSGAYTVCLIVSSANCSDTSCVLVTTSGPSTNFAVFGEVYVGNTPADHFTAYLIVFDSTAGTLTAVDTFTSDPMFGHFFVFGAPNGDYMVKVALDSASAFYSSFLPTYYGDDPFWTNAITVNQRTYPLLTINMVAGNNPGGPGFIGGLVSQGANKTAGDPLHNMSVLLTDMNDTPIDYTLTDGNGEFAFGSVPFGTYKVWVDMWGRSLDYYTVTIDATNPQVHNRNFEVHSDEIVATNQATNNDPFNLASSFKLYPNPAQGQLNVEMEVPNAGDLEVRIINAVGQTVMEQAVEASAGRINASLDMHNFPKGVYHIAISQNDNLLVTQRFSLVD